MIYGYIRVSTQSQTTENQKIVIEEWAKKRKTAVNIWISETVSGTSQIDKRKLGKLVNQLDQNDVLIITELSRLGRSLFMIMNVLQKLLEKKVKVIAIKENYELGDNIQSKVLAFAFGLSAEIERQLISERTKAGLERAKLNNKRIGRPLGKKSHHYKLTALSNEIMLDYSSGLSCSKLAKKYNVHWSTMDNFLKNVLKI